MNGMGASSSKRAGQQDRRCVSRGNRPLLVRLGRETKAAYSRLQPEARARLGQLIQADVPGADDLVRAIVEGQPQSAVGFEPGEPASDGFAGADMNLELGADRMR